MQRTKDRETENRRGWRVLKVLERNVERLWAVRPAVKQDGGHRCARQPRELSRNRMRLQAVLPTEQRATERGKERSLI